MGDVGDGGRAPSVDSSSAQRDTGSKEQMTGLAREDSVIDQEGRTERGGHVRGGSL